MPRCLRSPREEPGVQSLSPSVVGQAKNQDDNLKKAQTQVPDPYRATHQENSGRQRPHPSLSHDSQSADDSYTRSRRKERNQYRSCLQEGTLSRQETDGSILRRLWIVLHVLFSLLLIY